MRQYRNFELRNQTGSESFGICPHLVLKWGYMGSSTETVAFQVYEILKTDPEFLQFF